MPGFLSDPFIYRDVPGTRSVPIQLGEESEDDGWCDEIDGTVVSGRIRFYDPTKGYGFVETGDGDAYLAAVVLSAFGIDTVASGATIRFEAAHGDSGIVVREIVEIDAGTAVGQARKPVHRGTGPTKIASGVVTAWREDKGFGFVETDAGDTVFVHVSKAGGSNLAPGARVETTYAMGEKGFVASVARPIR